VNKWTMFNYKKVWDFGLEKIEDFSRLLSKMFLWLCFGLLSTVFFIGLFIYALSWQIIVIMQNKYLEWKENREKKII